MQNLEDINFPVYRKYNNNQRYYKIITMKEFEEVQVIGSKRIINYIVANKLPDFNLIRDLLFDFKPFAVEINEAEYLLNRPL